MEKGDIASWASQRYIVVLEGGLAEHMFEQRLLRRKPKLLPADQWHWQLTTTKSIVDKVHRLNASVEVVTFIPEAADPAAEWLSQYHVPVSEVLYSDFGQFCESLKWRQDVQQVVDNNPDRFRFYGQKGYALMQGATF